MPDLPGKEAQRLRPRGSNQLGMGQFNERIVLQAVRLHGSLAKADLARLTKLSTQTVSLIINRLLEQGLVQKLEAQRGRVGQPSVPIAIDPDGAYAIGIKIGRRSLDVLLVDFLGQTRERATLRYDFPEPEKVFAEIETQVARLRASLGRRRTPRLAGIGIAAPLSLDGWQALLGVSPAKARRWAGIDMRARVQAMTDLPVEFTKDTAAACVAELVAGRGRSIPSFLYLFVDTFIGGGLVIDSQLRGGMHGNAGALGSMPLGLPAAGGAAPAQLLSVASLFKLEQRYREAGLDAGAVTDARAMQQPWLAQTRKWLQPAARAIALAIVNAGCVLDLDSVILDGSCERTLLDALLAAVAKALDGFSWEGVARPALLAGTIGSDARAIGGALLPLYAQFAPDRDLFLKLGS